LVALFAVFGAPRLQASLGIARTMYLNLAAFAVVVLVIAIWTTDRRHPVHRSRPADRRPTDPGPAGHHHGARRPGPGAS